MNLVTRLFAFPKSQTLKFNSGATVLALWQSEPGMRSTAPRQGPSTCPRCPGPPPPPPTHFAAVAHAEEVIAKHLHGAGPGGVDESPSEDVRQRRRPSRTHVSGGAAARVHGSRRAHRAGGRRAVPVAAERELLGRLAPASLGNRLPPAGRAQGLAPCLLGANRIFLL